MEVVFLIIGTVVYLAIGSVIAAFAEYLFPDDQSGVDLPGENCPVVVVLFWPIAALLLLGWLVATPFILLYRKILCALRKPR